MKTPILYRKRLIPEECVLLKNDILLYRNDEMLITKWNTLKPKETLHHGLSCYFLPLGVKVSKFFDSKGDFLYWYCDIVEYSYDKASDTYVFTDLLADVIVYPDGFVRVVDLDELADAMENGLLSKDKLAKALRILSRLLNLIYGNEFHKLTDAVDPYDR